MNSKKKQTVVAAIAAMLSVAIIASPLSVMAQERTSVPPAITQARSEQGETAPTIRLPKNLQAIAGTALKDVALPENWAWADGGTVVTTETEEYPARFRVDDVTYDYSNAEGYHAEGHYVERMVTVAVEPTKTEQAPRKKQKPAALNAPQISALGTGSNKGVPFTSRVGDVAIDDTNFPDPIFREYVSTTFDTNPKNGSLSQNEIDAATRINVASYSAIADLKGIEYFTALTYLDCHGTKIQALDISRNRNLETLYCYNTEMKDLDVRDNPKLTVLFCHNTEIKALDVRRNSKLISLNCSGTRIQALDVNDNPNLEILYCYNTEIQALDVSDNPKLTVLFCQDTEIQALDVRRNINLKFLNCQDTPLAWLNVGNNTSLTNLYVSKPTIRLIVTAATFNIKDKVKDIDPQKVTITDNGSINPATGEVSGYDLSKPMTYIYDCGMAAGRPVSLEVTVKLNSSIIEITGNLDMPYSGSPVANPDVKKNGSTGEVTFTYEAWNGSTWESLSGAPTNAGKYRVQAHLAADGLYDGAQSLKKEFTISKAANGWKENLSIVGWAYGDKAAAPTAKAKFGSVVFSYSDSPSGTYTDKVPTNAGTWYVKAAVSVTGNYTGLETALAFTIAPKNAGQLTIPDMKSDQDVENLVIKDGDKELKKGTDYNIDQKQDGSKVTVTITFKGNYTGTVTKAYTVGNKAPSGGDKDKGSNKLDGTETDKKAVQTGDTTPVGLWWALLAFSAGAAVFLMRKKHIKKN